jgi:hypothetical protein
MARNNSRKRNWIYITNVIDCFFGYDKLGSFYSLFASFIWLPNRSVRRSQAKAVAGARAAYGFDAPAATSLDGECPAKCAKPVDGYSGESLRYLRNCPKSNR